MNNREQNTEDPLRSYLGPERIEKAPEGFTSNVMSCIQIETLPIRAEKRMRNKSLIPYISAIVVVLFIVVAFLLPGSKSDPSTFPAMEFLKNINVALQEIDITSAFKFNFPVILVYVFVGILVLSLFDRALYGMFNREK